MTGIQTRSNIEFSEIPQEAFDIFMYKIGNRKSVPTWVAKKIIEEDIWKDYSHKFPKNCGIIALVKTFRSFALEYGTKDNRGDNSFYEKPSIEELAESLKSIIEYHETEYESLKKGIGTKTEKGIALLKAKDLIEQYYRF